MLSKTRATTTTSRVLGLEINREIGKSVGRIAYLNYQCKLKTGQRRVAGPLSIRLTAIGDELTRAAVAKLCKRALICANFVRAAHSVMS